MESLICSFKEVVKVVELRAKLLEILRRSHLINTIDP